MSEQRDEAFTIDTALAQLKATINFGWIHTTEERNAGNEALEFVTTFVADLRTLLATEHSRVAELQSSENEFLLAMRQQITELETGLRALDQRTRAIDAKRLEAEATLVALRDQLSTLARTWEEGAVGGGPERELLKVAATELRDTMEGRGSG